MALKKTIEFKGINVVDAYIRASRLIIHAGNASMEFDVHTMANADSPALFFFSEVAEYSLEGGNPLAQAYAHLKTLEQYKDAEDC